MRSSLTLLAFLLASPAFAQAPAAAQNLGPVPANPGGADAPAELARTPTDPPEAASAVVPSGEKPAEPAVAMPATEAVAENPGEPAAVVPAAAPAAEKPAAPAGAAASTGAAPLPAVVVVEKPRAENALDVGPAREPARDEATGKDELEGKIGAAVRMSAQAGNLFPVDPGTAIGPTPVETRLRIQPEVRYGAFGLFADLETTTGAVAGLPPEELVGVRTSHPPLAALKLRELFFEARGKTWLLRAGQMATSWGLGIVANSGTHDPAPGEGFGDARYGDSSYRLMIAGRPLFGLGGAFRALEPVLAADMVVRDDTADYWAGDRALQGIVALRFKMDEDRHVGVYTVVRHQRSSHAEDTRGTDAFVVDLAGKWQWKKDDENLFAAGFELLSISGSSSMARSDTAPVQQLRQFGAALKSTLRLCRLQFYLDAGYASGDQNPFDDKLEGFRFDPDYNVGLVLFDEVMGYQSARASVRATDPALVALPPDGVELLPTRGSVTGAAYLFPRVRYGVSEWLDVYGGPLFAVATAKLTDPFATRVGGGEPLNALGGTPGGYLGTELDLGAQARFKPHPAVQVTTTAEAGLLLPGSAFSTASGGVMGPVGIGRLRLGVNL